MLARAACPPLAALGGGCQHLLAGLSTAADSVVSEMVGYARANFKANPEQANDILKSGLGFKNTGPEAGRLYLAQTEIEAERNRWPEVADLARKAAAAASDAEPSSPDEALLIAEVELVAEATCVHASLAQGRDADAFSSAQQCMDVARKSFAATGSEDRRWQGLVLATSMAGLAQHAACDFEAAAESFGSMVALADHQDPRQGPPKDRDHLVPAALKQAALFGLATGEHEAAARLSMRALSGAKQAAAAAKGSTDVMLSELLTGEAVADAHLAAAQVSFDDQDWEAAEKMSEQAVAVCEELSGANTARISIPLLMLGKVYSRSGRVTLAEGLYRGARKAAGRVCSRGSSCRSGPRGRGLAAASPRSQRCCRRLRRRPPRPSCRAAECSKMLGLDPTNEDWSLTAVHPSVGALLAWRYAQLLTAMPKRATEAGRWERLARAIFDERPVGSISAPESVFGTVDNLTGRGEGGSGIIIDLMSRRILARAVAPALTTVGGAEL